MENFWNTVLEIIIFLLSLSVLVCIHEAGHLTAAKIFKVYCYEFSIGMGPAIYSHKPNAAKKQETQFSIRCLPVGGYVAMAGEDLENAEDVDKSIVVPKDRVLESKARWKQVIIMGAGVFMNFVLGFILLIISYSCCTQAATKYDWNYVTIDTSNQISEQKPDQEGVLLESGDQIVYIEISYTYKDSDGQTVGSTSEPIKSSDITVYYDESLGDSKWDKQIYYMLSNMTYDANGNRINYAFEPDVEKYLGITDFTQISRDIKFGFIKSGDQSNATKYTTLENNVSSGSSEVTYANGDKGYLYSFNTIGISSQYCYFKYTFGQALQMAWNRWCYSCSALFVSVASLFNPATWSQVGGIISIFKLSAQATTIGIGTYLNFWALISINLGVMNLLPFPALDGWQILITLIEGIYFNVKKLIYKIKYRKKMAKEDLTTLIKQDEEKTFKTNAQYKKVKRIVSTVGMALLLVLMVVLVVKDIVNPIV